MEPFSTNQIQFSQSAQSIINHSNLPSRKGSFHTDDSLAGGSPHGTTTTNANAMIFGMPAENLSSRYGIPPHFPVTAGPGGLHGQRVPIESTLSVFSRQSTTHFKSNYGHLGGGNHTHTATASIACNEGGPIGLREYSHANKSHRFGIGPHLHATAPSESTGIHNTLHNVQ